jgi:serine/threonine-protein kinase
MVPEQPELPVALGALLALAAPPASPAPQAGPPARAGSPGREKPSWPPSYPPAGPPAGPPRRARGRRLAVVGAVAAVLVALLGVAAFGDPGGLIDRLRGDGGSPGTGQSPETDTPETGTPGTGSPPADAGAAPAGFTACDVGLPGAFCPTTPRCWNGIVDIGPDLPTASRADCAQPHYWQTYAAAYLPAEPDDDNLIEHPAVVALCRDDLLAARRTPAARSKPWKNDVLAQEVGGRILVHCVAARDDTGEWTGSSFLNG